MPPRSKDPLVSVFLPAYNQENFITEAIESALQQDIEDMEIVVGDDCSTDNTWEIIKSYQKQYPGKIVAFRNKHNLGITGNCNEVLSRCRGKFVAFHAGDDIFLPGKLNSQLEVFRKNTQCTMCYHDIEVFDCVSDKTIKHWNHGLQSSAPKEGNCQRFASWLVRDGTDFFAALSVMVRRDCIPETGYDYRIPFASDWFMWIEICANSSGEVEFLDGVYARYRKHENSITNILKSDKTDQLVTLALVESKYPCLRGDVRKRRGYNYYLEGVREIRNGCFGLGRHLLIQGSLMHIYSAKWIGWWLYSWYKQMLAKL